MKKAKVPRRKIYPYNPVLKEYARKNRNNPTRSEKTLWQQLKGDKVMNYDFHRQKPIGNYICDFFCHELCLCIELDGITHQDELVKIKDKNKEQYLNSMGIFVLRFEDDMVLSELHKVIAEIKKWITEFEMRKKVLGS